MAICKYQRFENVCFITNNPKIRRLLVDKSKYIFFSSKLGLLRILLRKQISFKILLAARVDDSHFQIIFHLGKFGALYTFDEGLFSVLDSSSYNSQFSFNKKSRKKKIANLIFKMPLPTSQYLAISKKHFTWFDPNSFKDLPLKNAEIIAIPKNEDLKAIKNIFIGQPWNFMHFNNNMLQELSAKIKHHGIDIYICHPRENISQISKFIDPNIQLVTLEYDVETFINSLSKNSPLNVFTFASSASVNLITNVQIYIVSLLSANKDSTILQKNLISVLKKLNTEYILV